MEDRIEEMVTRWFQEPVPEVEREILALISLAEDQLLEDLNDLSKEGLE